MENAFEEQYRGYTLKCQPQMSHDRRFLAYLVVAHGADPAFIDKAATLDLTSFATEGEAAFAARAAGMRWVDDALSLETSSSWARKPHRKSKPVTTSRGVAAVAAGH
jgi:hypothetical protein